MSFPIGDKDYVVPPVGFEAGNEILKVLSMSPAQLEDAKITSQGLYKLGLSDALWDQMLADNVPHHAMWRAGLASVIHFQTLAANGTNEAALLAAEGVWESGISPEALAAWMAAQHQQNPGDSTTSPSGAKAGSSTKPRANTSGTTSSRTRQKATASRGRSS
ncbi:hypothetical protein [Jatrophihabitans sp. GAS493]|uniref:DUF7426 family protein n=1 Tax=Jatrophihabitans sp. GAS493 TaxID=1907575 RepID=UPI000BB7C8CE|nr:hypothetical protein [Jatrophihabitans sp. GAS493]